MEQVRDRMVQVWPIVWGHFNMAQAQVYNRSAQLCIFLVLIPTAEYEFLAKW